MESDHIMRPLAPILAVSRVSPILTCVNAVVAHVSCWAFVNKSPCTGKSR